MRRKVLLTTISAAILALIAWRYVRCLDRVYTFYGSRGDAVTADAIGLGWIPSFLPKSARDIHEEHDLDTNQVWLRFTISPKESLFTVDTFHRISELDAAELEIPRPCQRGWWFRNLIEAQPADDTALHARVYVGEAVVDATRTHRAYLAVDRLSPTVYYWTMP